MILSGGCQCGAVRYEVDGPPNSAGICECRMCQRATGAFAYADAQFDGDKVRWTTGRPRLFGSSTIADRGFCADCGTSLTYQNRTAGTVSIMIATLDDPEAIRPSSHVGIEGRPSWFADLVVSPGSPTEAMPDGFEDLQYKGAGTTAAPGDA